MSPYVPVSQFWWLLHFAILVSSVLPIPSVFVLKQIPDIIFPPYTSQQQHNSGHFLTQCQCQTKSINNNIYHLKSASSFYHCLSYLTLKSNSKYGCYKSVLERVTVYYSFQVERGAIYLLHWHNRCKIRTILVKPKHGKLP